MTEHRAQPRGPLAMIGGRLESDNEAVFEALKTLSRGRLAVLAMASDIPLEVGDDVVSDCRRYGIDAELVPLYWDNRRSAAFDPSVIELVRTCGSVFFTGGDQSRIVESLIQDGCETPVLQQIRRCHESGGLLSGSSAGSAVMSGPMICSGTSLRALSAGLVDENSTDEDGFRIGQGLGFFGWGLVDQHFMQRGRLGRLLAAMRELQLPFGFGIDENSALLVEGERATVCGETGVMVVDMRKAKFDHGGYDMQGVQLSFLDDGDSFDLSRGKALPAEDKKRVRVTKTSYRRPAPVRRHAFASYALYDLLLRLVEGDPAHYRHDSALAFDELERRQVCIELERKKSGSRSLRAVRDGEIRYSAIGFDLRVRSCEKIADAHPAESAVVLPPDPVPGARLVLLGNSPITWSRDSLEDLLSELREPVGVLAMASAEPKRVAASHVDWLESLGLRAEVLDISLNNIERASRDRSLLNRIASMGSLLFTGGDQRRLTETLLHCAEATPVLHVIVSAYERGVPLIGVAASAAAFASRMIVEGDSEAALRYGASEDAGFSGLVIEAGIGLTSFGLVDQNFLNRHRLGRLLVACAAERSRFGFGLCEGSGIVIVGGERRLQAIGAAGVIVATLDPRRLRLQPPQFSAAGIRLSLVEPGTSFHLDTLATDAVDRTGAGLAMLERSITDLARDYNAGRAPGRIQVDDQQLRSEFFSTAALH